MDARLKTGSIFSATIDLDAVGKQFGHIQIPYSRDEAGLSNLLVPIVSIRNGNGPCLLLNAGTHGDEFEGQIVLRNLAHELNPINVSGQVIIIPSLNLPAVLNNSRCSPIDDANLNRIFPGNVRGTISEKIATYVCEELVQRADFVVDLHAGGRRYGCLCHPMMHHYSLPETSHRTFELLKSFQAPYGVVFDTEPDRDGMLDTFVEDANIPFIAVELGSSGTVTPQSVALAARGVRNVLLYTGILRGEIKDVDTPMEILGVPENGFVVAEDNGIFEPFVELGETVTVGQSIGQLHSIHRPDRAPITHTTEEGGLVLVRRTTGTTSHGDCLLIVANTIEPNFEAA